MLIKICLLIYVAFCYVTMGVMLKFDRVRESVEKLSESLEKKANTILNVIFFFSPVILTLFILRAIYKGIKNIFK